ncbi:hypothetical protein HOLleu_23765 [Holothuria leucospilota]|uniref:Uncharacterized protein n=1 Tax=Holothuria leucospilota TaxID=206669 RepID=A0A9Q1BVG7_HOLLE|nr:hypothetical protein HOLleu_23765 [Holothuria leucospilota]
MTNCHRVINETVNLKQSGNAPSTSTELKDAIHQPSLVGYGSAFNSLAGVNVRALITTA